MTSSRLSTPRPPPPQPMWQGGGQEPRGALGGASVTSRWPEAKEMARPSPSREDHYLAFLSQIAWFLCWPKEGLTSAGGAGVSGD